ncbi:CHASE2 domain-containing protein [Pseudoprevotella muciniphila]|uniref:CHASE2 domain-containing protein n=1 Tax=Pseudoprevotella muciniphila TaxID=2133944 RepID=A0A5P8E4M4_9BACT|nr:CHASE2 domain-containing protein [Pseudoprevotella muciniphila]QFQ11876.1 CHASE2 domain-containing protein [Pseudoprevotella muciniphila]
MKSTLIHILSTIGFFDVLSLLILCTPLALFFNLSKLDPTYWLSNFSTNHNQLTTKTLYEIYNANHNGDDEINEILTLVDVKDITSRKKLATLIDTIYNMNPIGIAVDFMFPSPQEVSTDRALVETVKKVKDKTFFAYMLKDFDKQSNSFCNSEHSFFLNPNYPEWFCDSVKEGYANMKNNGTSESVWKYSVVEKINNKKVFSLPAMLIGEECFNDYQPHESYIINYKRINVKKLSPDSLDYNKIKDHFVIVGSYKYSGDRFDSPLGMIPGMLVHAYIVQSINCDTVTEQSPTGNFRMTVTALLILIIVLILTDVFVYFLRIKCNYTFGAMIIDGIFPSIFIGIIAVVLVKAYSYHLLMDNNVFAHGQSAINGILIAAAIIKVIYTSLIIYLSRHKTCNRICSFSIYYKINNH